jgi:hypothetical protein
MTSLRGVVGVVRGSISSLSSVRNSTIRRMVDLRSMIDVGVYTVLGIGDFNFTPMKKAVDSGYFCIWVFFLSFIASVIRTCF